MALSLQPQAMSSGRSRTATTSALTSRQRKQYAVFMGLWLLLSGYFWIWWLQPTHIGNLVLFAVISCSFFYNGTLLPSWYLFYVGQMRRPVHVPVHEVEDVGIVRRVAVITLTVPGSESLDIVKRQMAAMVAIRYPHDSWILVDKEHSPAIKQLALRMGVRYFCRHDGVRWGAGMIVRWNAIVPPFQTKTKAGNVNSWLDMYGDGYTHFTQLDIDHCPTPSYLDRVLGFFKDPTVAWVQGPSVYGNHEHWTARGSAEQEFVLQGPLQMGFFGFSRTPFIIGSHCTYDMAAIRGIGGFQPTRAEDHLDTVCLAAEGRQGVFLPEVIAVGDGPETFDTYLGQQFAWAFSMIQVLLSHTPKLLHRYTPRQAVQFLFVQTWYPFWSSAMLVLFFSPLLALSFNASISHVKYLQFLLHSTPAALTATGLWWWSRPWHQPKGIGLSWRGVVLHIARWVVVLSAFVQVLLRVKKPYMITVKGLDADRLPPLRLSVLGPYLGLISVALAACWFYILRYSHSASQGYLLFALQGAAVFWLMLLFILAEDGRTARRASVSLPHYGRLRAGPYLAVIVTTTLLGATVLASASRIRDAVLARTPAQPRASAAVAVSPASPPPDKVPRGASSPAMSSAAPIPAASPTAIEQLAPTVDQLAPSPSGPALSAAEGLGAPAAPRTGPALLAGLRTAPLTDADLPPGFGGPMSRDTPALGSAAAAGSLGSYTVIASVLPPPVVAAGFSAFVFADAAAAGVAVQGWAAPGEGQDVVLFTPAGFTGPVRCLSYATSEAGQARGRTLCAAQDGTVVVAGYADQDNRSGRTPFGPTAQAIALTQRGLALVAQQRHPVPMP